MSIAEQLAKMEQQLEKEVQEKQQALEDFRNGAAMLLSRTRGVVGANGNNGVSYEAAYGANTRIVRTAIRAMTSPWSVKTLYKHLGGPDNETLSKQAITTVIHRLRANGYIHIRRQGKGRRATIYQPLSPTTT